MWESFPREPGWRKVEAEARGYMAGGKVAGLLLWIYPGPGGAVGPEITRWAGSWWYWGTDQPAEQVDADPLPEDPSERENAWLAAYSSVKPRRGRGPSGWEITWDAQVRAAGRGEEAFLALYDEALRKGLQAIAANGESPHRGGGPLGLVARSLAALPALARSALGLVSAEEGEAVDAAAMGAGLAASEASVALTYADRALEALGAHSGPWRPRFARRAHAVLVAGRSGEEVDGPLMVDVTYGTSGPLAEAIEACPDASELAREKVGEALARLLAAYAVLSELQALSKGSL